MVAEGLLIALAATRMAVKNEIIVGALRHHTTYRAEDYVETARHQIGALIRENEDHAERLCASAQGIGTGSAGDPVSALTLPTAQDDTAVEKIEDARRVLLHQVYVGLGDALRDELASDERILALVETARRDAWDEVGAAWHQLIAPAPDVRADPDYERERSGRLQEFVYIDLAGLRVGER